MSDPRRWCDAWVEAPDSDAGRELAPLCRGLNAALIAALKKRATASMRASRCAPAHLPDGDRCGVRRVPPTSRAARRGRAASRACKFPRSAPSRSTLKLEEALLVLLDEDERERWLKPGMRAVDLGASPGGWTWQLVQPLDPH